MKKSIYVGNTMGLPKLKRVGQNTRLGTPRTHVYKVVIHKDKYKSIYFKVQFHRSGKHFYKYFNKKKDAKMYVEWLKLLEEV